MSVRKWRFAALTALPLVFLSCPDTSPVDGKTYIAFQNPELFPARMYKDPSRLELFTEVPPGRIKNVEAQPNAGGVTFYPVFLVEMEGIHIEQQGESVTVRVDEGKVNRADIPALTIETGFAYIKIENAGAYPISFNKGSDELTPLEAASSIVMPNETAAYRIEPETADLYKVMKNGDTPLDFPAAVSALGEFSEDTIYVFRYDGNALAIIRASPLNASGVAIWKADSDAAFNQAVSGINLSTAASHHIVLTKDVTASGVTFIANANKTITIRGDENRRSIANAGKSALFTIPAGIALRLEANITINGGGTEYNAAHVNGGTFEMNDGSIISGAKDSAVKVDGGTFTMKGGEISGNTSKLSSTTSSGGGVYVAGGTFTMSGGQISGNSTSASSYSSGGGVYVGSGTFTMSGGEISGNTSSSTTSSGGGVYVAGGTFSMSGGQISGNSVNSSGGGVYVAGGTFSMSGGEISGNTSNSSASSSGGGVYVAGGTFSMSGGQISGNTSSSSKSSNSTTSYSSYGGGVYVGSNATFTMSGGQISGNSAASSATSYGGGVYVGSNATFTMSGGEISGNSVPSSSSYYGDGVFVDGSATLTMSGGEISGNAGSGVSAESGTFTMSNGEISGNTGDGVFVDGSATLTMSGGEISGNAGSGVSAGSGTFTMSNGEISGNTGDGVYVRSGTFRMSDGAISGNTGSGVYVSNNATFTMSGGEISGNTGDGVYVAPSSGTLASGTFTKSGGGTIYAANSTDNGRVVYVTSYKQRVTPAGPDVALDSRISGGAGGWESSVGISDITYSSVSGGGTWTSLSDGSLKSPAISYNSVTKFRVKFTSAADNAFIMIELGASSPGADYNGYAFISELDNNSATCESGYYSGSVIFGRGSATVIIPAQTAGSHFIDVGYQKKASLSGNSDYAWFKVIN